MRKLFVFLAMVQLGTTMASNKNILALNFNNGFIFVERGITFSVYPDGEFDFYMNTQLGVNARLHVGPVGITFNSGFDYGPFVQYDDFGAVVQIENIPIYYDYYGRVNRIGNVSIWYRNNRVYRIGGMQIFYNPSGIYAYHTGFINTFNRAYIFNPFHTYFVRPATSFCLVSRNPYRQWYRPIRYRYFEPFRNNTRRSYAQIGRINKHIERADRNRIYQNNSRVSARSSSGTIRSNRTGSSRNAIGMNERSESVTRSANTMRSNANQNSSRTKTSLRSNSDAAVPRFSSPQANRNLGNVRSNSGIQKSNLTNRSELSTPSFIRQNSQGKLRQPNSTNRSQVKTSRQGPSRNITRTATENRRSSVNSRTGVKRSGNN